MDNSKPTSEQAKEAVDKTASQASSTVDQARDTAKAVVQSASNQVNVAADRAKDLWGQSKDRVTETTLHAQADAVAYAKNEPLKAMLMAAAVGAALMAVVAMLARSDD